VIENFKISPNIWFNEATHTNNAALLTRNRQHGLVILPKLVLTAHVLIEPVRHYVLKDTPFEVHSFGRSLSLNAGTAGSSVISQHPLGEAVDWSPWGAESYEECYMTFLQTRKYFIDHKVMFGQLIFEEAARDYGRAQWIHMSMGTPFRDIRRCGDIKTMKDGKYKMLEKVDVSKWWG